MSHNKIRMLFFVGGIFSGGKERRLLELLCCLKKNDKDYIKSVFFPVVDMVNFYFPNQIIANSKAGIKNYKAPIRKTKLIDNGFNLDRFQNLKPVKKVREYYGINNYKLVGLP